MTLTRRNFLRSSAVSAAAIAGVGAAHAAELPKGAEWNETCSLLVIGTGFAGLGAALESHYLGMKDILVVDKMPSAGGNSIINGGAIGRCRFRHAG